MIKVIIACGSIKFPDASFEFARQLHARSPLRATAEFLPQYDLAHLWLLGDPMYGQPVMPLPEEDETEALQRNKDRFCKLCQSEGIAYQVREETAGMTGSILQKETRFADVLLLDSSHFYEYMGTGASNPSIQDTLYGAECPVIVVPENAALPVQNILAYDGSASSVYAMKQYAYLFPELSHNKTLLIHFSSKKGEAIPEVEKLQELLWQHYPDLTFMNLNMQPGDQLDEHPGLEKRAIIVCGSYSRPLLSRLFKKSFAAPLIDQHEFPLFIAHL
jgi:hypothetical protein